MSTVAEFIYFQLKPSVKPEDPSNEEGLALLRILQATTQQSGYRSSAWGRTIEDECTIVWVIEWSDAHGSMQPSLLADFMAPDTQIRMIFTTIQPPISETETLTKNPVTELCPLAFPNSMGPQERSALCEDFRGLRTALLDEAPQEVRAKSFAMGQVERPGTVELDKSPSGLVFVHMIVIGWDSVDTHIKCKETEAFTRGIGPIRGKMIGPMPGLGMKHARFQRIDEN